MVLYWTKSIFFIRRFVIISLKKYLIQMSHTQRNQIFHYIWLNFKGIFHSQIVEFKKWLFCPFFTFQKHRPNSQKIHILYLPNSSTWYNKITLHHLPPSPLKDGRSNFRRGLTGHAAMFTNRETNVIANFKQFS